MSKLQYSIVIATRNRPDALSLSIPRMLDQSRPPAQLVIVDSSDDHSRCVSAVTEALVGCANDLDFEIIQSERGLTRQRNRGLQSVKYPIVMYPDDDSIWYPGVAEEKMRVYENDLNKAISAVCGLEVKTPPEDFEAGGPAAYKMRLSDQIKQQVGFRRTQFERRFFPDPAKLLGESFYHEFENSAWHQEHEVVPVEWMTGFRMSFRTEVIRKIGFDEVFNDYSLFEDIDASFGAWTHGSVVAAKRAKVFHYKSPERRGDGRRLGAEQLLNKSYVVAKHSAVSEPTRKLMSRYARYKVWQYRLTARDTFGRERLAGAQRALREIPSLMSMRGEELVSRYRQAVQAAVSDRPHET